MNNPSINDISKSDMIRILKKDVESAREKEDTKKRNRSRWCFEEWQNRLPHQGNQFLKSALSMSFGGI